MSDLSHDTADDGFHEIQLSGKQLVFLFIVTTTVIVVVFLCGVKVGRGARAAQGEDADPATAAAPSAQTAAETTAATAGQPAAEPPAPASDTPDELSYHKRLQGDAPPDKLKPQAESKPESAPPAASVPAPRAAVPAPTPDLTAADDLPTSGRPGTWAVQVIATRDRAIAASVLKKLAAKGYPAFLVNPPAGASPAAYFKVHVGRYNERSEAEQVSQRIKKEEQFQSWITR